MRVDFWHSATRHWRDAEILFHREDVSGSRPSLPGADQLYGLAAECGMKAVLVRCGATTDPATGDLDRRSPHRTHLPGLWSAYQTFLQGRGEARYCLTEEAPFHDWAVDQRYAAGDDLPSDEAVERHRLATREVMRIATQAVLDGGGVR